MASTGGELTAYEQTAWGQIAAGPAARAGGRRAGRIVFWFLFGLAVVSLGAGAAAAVAKVQVYTDSSTAMQNTVPAGSTLIVLSGADVRRGDMVLFRRLGFRRCSSSG